MRVVFVHGAGRSGADAWPGLQGDDYAFVTRHGFAGAPARTDFDADTRIVLDAVGEGAHVVAHSYGGIAAVGAAASGPVASLVLVEPAVFSLSRGLPATEEHIAAVEPVMKQWRSTDAAAYHVRLFTAFGVPDVTAPDSAAALEGAERLRLQRPPWHAVLDPTVFQRVPTLVVTGGWNDEYEELAARLVALGAGHRELAGFGHSAHHHPAFANVVRDFWKHSTRT